MIAEATPMRWPAAWRDAGAVDLLRGTAVNLILVPQDAAYDPVRARAREAGVAVETAAPAGVMLAKGSWPGIQSPRNGGAEAGPTGVPWVDSNGWLVRLKRALEPAAAVWVDAPPQGRTVYRPGAYELAVADAAAHGGRWILSLDDQAAAQAGASAAWKRAVAAAGYFAAQRDRSGWAAAAVIGVVSDFAGANEFMGQELLNLLARTGQQYRVVRKDRADFAGLRAILYADGEAPSPALRSRALAFAEAGGTVIATPVWGTPPGRADLGQHPRFAVYPHGKGRIAIAREPDDPYVLANDTVILVSHRYDLVRCFNSGSYGAYYTVSPDRKSAVVHLLFYADRGPADASVRVMGPFRGARISTVEQPEPRPVKCDAGAGWVEAHLPQVPPYVALELSA